MNDPQVAPGGKPFDPLGTVSSRPVPVTSGMGTPAKNVSIPYAMSNAASVGPPPHPFGSGPPIANQPDMRPTGSIPSFEKLQPKNMPVTPGPMGLNYET